MPLGDLLALIATGAVAAAMNAIGGGGSFVALPVLIALGVSSIQANAAGTVALLPGGWLVVWAYRGDLRGFAGARLAPLLGTSLAGGLAGAALLLATPTRAFDAALPWLVLLATLTFALGPRAGALLRRFLRVGPGGLLAIQFVLAIYAGYFGGGVGIMMMAAWSLLTLSDLPAMNAVRMLMVSAANTVAAGYFILSGAVPWPQTLTMLAGGLAGSIAGAALVKRLKSAQVRIAIVVLGLAIAAGFFMRNA